MAKKLKLADVLWEAANSQLCVSEDPSSETGWTPFTCDAIMSVTDSDTRDKVCAWMRNRLGFPRGAAKSLKVFCETPEGEARQGVRYMWLLLAMHVAEDEGIEIEVNA